MYKVIVGIFVAVAVYCVYAMQVSKPRPTTSANPRDAQNQHMAREVGRLIEDARLAGKPINPLAIEAREELIKKGYSVP